MKSWGSTRGLTPAEVNTEAFALVRMWRAPGVKRLWHVQRDVLRTWEGPYTVSIVILELSALEKRTELPETQVGAGFGITT